MNNACGKEWTRKFLTETFTKSFVSKEWKKHQTKVLFDQEVALLPATQPLVERQIEKENNLAKISAIDAKIRELERKKRQIRDLIHYNSKVVPTASKFVRACPAETCRGFLSSHWKCGLCSRVTCSDCHVLKATDKEHVCNPDDVATAKLLSKDTKPCPKCSASIFKISGCDQMWCTQCHTAFSWKTGNIETRIHNPHYYEWQRQTRGEVPRENGDVVCGRQLDHRLYRDIQNIVHRAYHKNPEYQSLTNLFMNIIVTTIHILEEELGRYVVDTVNNHQQLRISYLRNGITKEEFMVKIERETKKQEYSREIHGLLRLYIDTVTDIVYRAKDLCRLKSTELDMTPIIAILNEVKAIRAYVNTCFMDIANYYLSTRTLFIKNVNQTSKPGISNDDALSYITLKLATDFAVIEESDKLGISPKNYKPVTVDLSKESANTSIVIE
jgi:hypothetical protein